jgi:signal transduction histidine kinase
MPNRNCLILTQYREDGLYNDFIGRFYHFPATENKNYLNQFQSLPIEIVYYEPEKRGKGEFYGYGRITKPPFEDKREPSHYFVEIFDYKPFSNPVYFKNNRGEVLEKLHNFEFYNYNNSVRKVSPKFLDEICLDGGILLNFQADAHLVQVLGEQLIASERVGILELVKNSFDAGATHSNVRIENIPNINQIPKSNYLFSDYIGPVIIVEDDGRGMTKEQIELGWLRPASTLKTNIKERIKEERRKAEKENKIEIFENYLQLLKSENKGRIPLGEKGVGRFACHRLGKYLIIKTKVAQNEYEYILKIHWDDFNLSNGVHKNLEDVKISLTRQAISRDYGHTNSGTQLIIYGGREGFEFTPFEINQINKTILKLNSPNPHPKANQTEFKASFDCPQVKDLDEVITYQKFEPVFQIFGLVDEWGNFDYEYSFTPPYNIPLTGFNRKEDKRDLKVIEKDYWFEDKTNRKLWRKPVCGSFYLHLDVWYRDKPWIGTSTDEKHFKNYLESYGGISIYRDGINVYSAENGTSTDWLGLRQRQIKQAYRMSYYHMMGNIEIDQTSNLNLIDKTNREGLIQNRAAEDFVSLTRAITRIVEQDYIGKRNEYNALSGEKDVRRIGQFSKQSAAVINNIVDNYEVNSDPYRLFNNIQELSDISERRGHLVQLSKSLKTLEGNLKQIQEVQDLLTEQAGFGLGIAVALHEINKTTSNFYYGILDVINSGQWDKIKLEELKDTSKALESELLRLSPLRALRNEEPIRYNVSKSINYVHSVFKRRFKKLNINFEYNYDQDFEILARYGALNQILTNLFDNSCYWLENPNNTNRRIVVHINELDKTLIVGDSGPGIHESMLPYLFQPGASLKFPPSGLGLYISKHYLNLMKKRGDIYLAKKSDRLKDFHGAQFILDFSNVNTSKDEE